MSAKNAGDLTRQEASLLLYFEDCAVNRAGVVDHRKMNKDDLAIVDEWVEQGCINFNRIKSDDLPRANGGSSVVQLSEWAWVVVAKLRRERAQRVFAGRNWQLVERRRDGVASESE